MVRITLGSYTNFFNLVSGVYDMKKIMITINTTTTAATITISVRIFVPTPKSYKNYQNNDILYIFYPNVNMYYLNPFL